MLRFLDVTVRYGTADEAALRELSLTIEPGDVVALVGPSGAGKSTILRAAAGLVLPSEGTVTVLGVDSAAIGRRSHRATRARVGSIHQDFALIGPLRVIHNVAAGRLGQWSSTRSIRSLLRPSPDDVAEIGTCLDRVGIAGKLWERADRLSGGQQQRTAIARVLYQQPDLLLADEPCSALDPARADAVLASLIGEVRSDGTPTKAFVASLHDAPLARRHCDRIVGLRRGVIEFDLPSAEVSDVLLRELYALEASAAG